MAMTATTPPTASTSMARLKNADRWAGLFFILPAMFFFTIFVIAPVLFGLWMSFQKVKLTGDGNTYSFIGFDNYWQTDPDKARGVLQRLFDFSGQEDFNIAMLNTARFAVIVTTVQTILALLLAVAVNQKIKGRTFFRTAFFFPSVSSSVVISIIFLWVFNQFGLINRFLSIFGVQGPNWVDDPSTALPSIMGLNIWTTSGTFMVIYLAALQDIPGHLYEAASVDGATPIQKFFSITVPLLAPTTFFIVTLGLIGTFQVFDQAYVISNGGGGPANSTLTAVFWIYRTAFKDRNAAGSAAAASVVLFLIIFSLTLIQRRFFRTDNDN